MTSEEGTTEHNILQVPNFLTNRERDHLLDAICASQDTFQQMGLPSDTDPSSFHLPLESEPYERADLKQIRKACEPLSKRILEWVPELFQKLEMDPFPVSNVPLTIMNGLNGHSAAPHTDESGGRYKISLLYYLHKKPRTFEGGALKLYETDATSPTGHSDKAFTKIEHEDNLFIAFPSIVYHGVTTVELDSTEFKEGRFVIVAFLGTK